MLFDAAWPVGRRVVWDGGGACAGRLGRLLAPALAAGGGALAGGTAAGGALEGKLAGATGAVGAAAVLTATVPFSRGFQVTADKIAAARITATPSAATTFGRSARAARWRRFKRNETPV